MRPGLVVTNESFSASGHFRSMGDELESGGEAAGSDLGPRAPPRAPSDLGASLAVVAQAAREDLSRPPGETGGRVVDAPPSQAPAAARNSTGGAVGGGRGH